MILSLQIWTELRVQWLNSRVLDSGLRDSGFQPDQCHSVVSLNKTHLSLRSTGSTQETCPVITVKLLTGT